MHERVRSGSGQLRGIAGVVTRGLALIAVAIIGLASVMSGAGQAQGRSLGAARPALVIHSDIGGYLSARRQEIERLRATGRRVELRGTCISACTMYLGLPHVCVSPQAVFGFHGPSRSGTPVAPEKFEYWSREMARSYREPLKSWYMTTGRYMIRGYFEISGTQLIAMGYHAC
ncbi:hypothetical protein [Rhodobacter maris]|uniref:Uncharacterized protein n=1 Tax=Rhodobacter maris TaxID=446682 RepID=A0A285RIU9_9RHOB|nr:hypothetical protein [Rhodobacter maris]SOB94056.1 hypothetical protein SAMN05877831_101316 [Rhodobacter maris]